MLIAGKSHSRHAGCTSPAELTDDLPVHIDLLDAVAAPVLLSTKSASCIRWSLGFPARNKSATLTSSFCKPPKAARGSSSSGSCSTKSMAQPPGEPTEVLGSVL